MQNLRTNKCLCEEKQKRENQLVYWAGCTVYVNPQPTPNDKLICLFYLFLPKILFIPKFYMSVYL
jgi:hypothetical protein